MFDPKLYREACREFTAPEDKIEEIIAMTEKTNQKKIRPLRAALIAAVAVAMMVVGVSAANPEGFAEFVASIATAVQIDDYRLDLTTTDGEQVTVFSIPEAEVQERDGRAVLVLNGEDEADITDALNALGKYTCTKNSGCLTIGLTVEGTVDDWIIMMQMSGDDSTVYTYQKDEEGNVVASADVTDRDGVDYTWTSVSTMDGNSVSFDDIVVK